MIEAKTLRALAKHSGYKPSSIFRMQPNEILEMLTEKYPDIKDWSEDRAKETINNLVADEQAAKVDTKDTPAEATDVTEEPKKTKKEPKKRTRRTKAQIEADKKEEETTSDKAPKEETSRTTPTRRRKKNKTPVPMSAVGSVSSEEIAELRERVISLQDTVDKLTVALDDVSMFMAWFHNVKVDPREPIEHLGSIDWAACIDDQVK